LIRFGDVVGILTSGHVLKAILKEPEIGLLCFQVRADRIQRLQLPLNVVMGHVAIGTPPWTLAGPDLAFLRLPITMIGEIERVATIVNGDQHRQTLSQPDNTSSIGVLGGVVDEMTSDPAIALVPNGQTTTTTFQAVINIGNVIQDDPNADRFRFQPIASPGMPLPSNYEGTSGAGLWKFFIDNQTCAVVQARLIGVAYYQQSVEEQLHILGHGPISIYDTLLNAIHEKWPLSPGARE
jgi:hypothetical protein